MSGNKIELEQFIKDNRFELNRYLASLFKQFNRFQTNRLNIERQSPEPVKHNKIVD